MLSLPQVIRQNQFSSVAQLSPTLCDPMDRITPGFPVHHQHLKLVQTHVHRVSDAVQPSHLLPSPFPPAFFPRIKIFSNDSVLHIRWPKYWSFSFSISPSNEYLGLISFILCPWDSPGKNTGVGCHFLLQGIFPTQGSNLGLLHCRRRIL